MTRYTQDALALFREVFKAGADLRSFSNSQLLVEVLRQFGYGVRWTAELSPPTLTELDPWEKTVWARPQSEASLAWRLSHELGHLRLNLRKIILGILTGADELEAEFYGSTWMQVVESYLTQPVEPAHPAAVRQASVMRPRVEKSRKRFRSQSSQTVSREFVQLTLDCQECTCVSRKARALAKLQAARKSKRDSRFISREKLRKSRFSL